MPIAKEDKIFYDKDKSFCRGGDWYYDEKR